MLSELSGVQATEAVKLVRVLASYACENDDAEDTCFELGRERVEMCGPCEAITFLNALEDA